MSKTYKGQITNSVVELTLQEEAVGAGFDTPTIVWDDTVNGEIDQVQGDIPDNWKNGGGIKQLQFGSSCTSIGSFAFSDCADLTVLVIPDSVTSIGSYAFNYCIGLTGSLTIPDSVTSIGSQAFYYCDQLTGSLTIPNSVTSIGSYAFGFCFSLTTAYLAPPLANVGSSAFLFSGLTTVYAKDAVASGWTLGAGQTVGGKT